MTATTLSGGTESTLNAVDAGRTTNNNTPPVAAVLRSPVQMTLKQTATIIVAGAVLAAWLAGADTKREIQAPIVITPRPIDLRGIELTKEIARLHDRLRPTTAPTERRRNLFAFRSAAPAPQPLPDLRSSSLPATSTPPPSGEPVLKLAGIAEDDGADGPSRIAFISGEGQLFMVKQGDAVTGRYRVIRISSDAVELSDVSAGIVRRLIFK